MIQIKQNAQKRMLTDERGKRPYSPWSWWVHPLSELNAFPPRPSSPCRLSSPRSPFSLSAGDCLSSLLGSEIQRRYLVAVSNERHDANRGR